MVMDTRYYHMKTKQVMNQSKIGSGRGDQKVKVVKENKKGKWSRRTKRESG